jgi:hypothetical protein
VAATPVKAKGPTKGLGSPRPVQGSYRICMLLYELVFHMGILENSAWFGRCTVVVNASPLRG